jgi:hypothetical protein
MPDPTIIRGSVPDCDWGFQITDSGRMDQCYRAYVQHCTEMHHADAESYIHFDLQKTDAEPEKVAAIPQAIYPER